MFLSCQYLLGSLPRPAAQATAIPANPGYIFAWAEQLDPVVMPDSQ